MTQQHKHQGVPTQMSRDRHLEAVHEIMGNLKLKQNSYFACTQTNPDIDYSNFMECDWINFYEGAVEAIPLSALLSRVKKWTCICAWIMTMMVISRIEVL